MSLLDSLDARQRAAARQTEAGGLGAQVEAYWRRLRLGFTPEEALASFNLRRFPGAEDEIATELASALGVIALRRSIARDLTPGVWHLARASRVLDRRGRVLARSVKVACGSVSPHPAVQWDWPPTAYGQAVLDGDEHLESRGCRRCAALAGRAQEYLGEVLAALLATTRGRA